MNSRIEQKETFEMFGIEKYFKNDEPGDIPAFGNETHDDSGRTRLVEQAGGYGPMAICGHIDVRAVLVETDCNPIDTKTNAFDIFTRSITAFEKQLKAKVCDLCGTTESKCFDIHHVNKVRNLKGKHHWERIMTAKQWLSA